jgi:hypothetical protein
MPAVKAVGIASDRPPRFRLPVLDDRGDVAARLAAIDSMIIDDSDVPRGDALTAAASATPADRDALANDAPPAPETRFRASTGLPSVDAPKRAVGTSAIGTSAVRTSRDRDATPTGRANAAPDQAAPGSRHGAAEGGDAPPAARVRAAVALPAHPPMIRPDDVQGAPVRYPADDWRGRIKGAPARADANVYGAGGGLASANPATGASATPAAPAGDATKPARDNGEATTAGPVGRPQVTGRRGQAVDTAKPISVLDRAARIALLGALLAIFVLLFIFGPKISQWWGTH